MASETFGLALLTRLARLAVAETRRFSGVSGATLSRHHERRGAPFERQRSEERSECAVRAKRRTAISERGAERPVSSARLELTGAFLLFSTAVVRIFTYQRLCPVLSPNATPLTPTATLQLTPSARYPSPATPRPVRCPRRPGVALHRLCPGRSRRRHSSRTDGPTREQCPSYSVVSYVDV
jgi:hypothetical protein